MALQNYITASDITYEPIKRVLSESGDPTYLDSYIARANDWYEDNAKRIGVEDLTALSLPVPFAAAECLNYFVAWKFGENNASLNVERFAAGDIYTEMSDRAFDRWRNAKTQLSAAYITGTDTARSDRSVSFGTIQRVS